MTGEERTLRRVMAAYVAATDAGAGDLLAVHAALKVYRERHPEAPPLEARGRVLGLIEIGRARAPGWYWRNLAAREE